MGRRLSIIDYVKERGLLPIIGNLAIRSSYYHPGSPTIIRPANKNAPHSRKTSNHTKHYQSSININPRLQNAQIQ